MTTLVEKDLVYEFPDNIFTIPHAEKVQLKSIDRLRGMIVLSRDLGYSVTPDVDLQKWVESLPWSLYDKE